MGDSPSYPDTFPVSQQEVIAMSRVHVADNLLEQKLFGFRVKRLAKAVGVPMAPFLVTVLVPAVPLPIQFVAFVGGVVLGTIAFKKTPPMQEPHTWIIGALRLNFTDGEYHRQPVGEEIEYQDNYTEIAPAGGTTQTKTMEAPQEVYDPRDMFGNSKNTLDTLQFDHIKDNGTLVKEDRFTLLVEIDPRDWLILDNEDREGVSDAFSRVLNGVDFPFQIYTLPVKYQNQEYEQQLRDATRKRGGDEPDVVTALRQNHLGWLDTIIDAAAVTERRYFLAVHVDREDTSVGLLDSFLSGDEEVDEDLLQRELRGRAEGLQADLTKTGVGATITDTRADVLELLHYAGHDSLPEYEFNHQPFAKPQFA
jgi:hypothetical protein